MLSWHHQHATAFLRSIGKNFDIKSTMTRRQAETTKEQESEKQGSMVVLQLTYILKANYRQAIHQSTFLRLCVMIGGDKSYGHHAHRPPGNLHFVYIFFIFLQS